MTRRKTSCETLRRVGRTTSERKRWMELWIEEAKRVRKVRGQSGRPDVEGEDSAIVAEDIADVVADPVVGDRAVRPDRERVHVLRLQVRPVVIPPPLRENKLPLQAAPQPLWYPALAAQLATVECRSPLRHRDAPLDGHEIVLGVGLHPVARVFSHPRGVRTA